LDGNAGFVSGELRLYVNGARVGTVTGIGAIYQNPNDPPGFSQGYVTAYNGKAKTINPELATATTLIDEPFNGVIDEFAYINQGTLSDARVAQLYSYGQTNSADTGFSVVTNTTAAPIIHAVVNSGAGGAGAGLVLSWPGTSSGYYLEYSTNLASGIWYSNLVVPGTVGGFNVITQAVGDGNRYFRLHHP